MAIPRLITIPSYFGTIRSVADPESPQRRPTRRVRGQRRYYRTIRRKAESFQVDASGWYDYAHWHVDWTGVGNLRWRDRRSHLLALFTMFRRALAGTEGWSTPHQVWIYINPHDSSEDAVYLHSPNPNAANVPNAFEGAHWDAEVPPRLREFIDPAWQFGRLDGCSTCFFVRPRPAS